MKTISVIIPAYNSEKYIKRCIDSVLTQRGADFEIIAVNDGSTDNTLKRLLEYGDRITVKDIANSGAANARNVGLELARGDFVMFLDSDDYLSSDAAQKIIAAQEEHNADIVRFRYEYVYKDGGSFVPSSQMNMDGFIEKSEFKEKIYPMFFKGIYLNSVCMSVYKREIVENIRFRTDMVTAEDAVFSLAAFSNAENVRFIPDIIYEYYQSNEGLTGRGISVFQKYRDNFTFAKATAGYLKSWGMNTPFNYARVFLRPAAVTVDKLKRVLKR